MLVAAGRRGRDQLDAAIAELTAAGVERARNDAEWLLADALGVGRFEVYLALEGELPGPVARRFADAVRRRARREPLQQILGWEAFHGLRLTVTPDVLVPRPETEVLVDWALELLPPPGRRPLVVDVGTGSGCIAAAVAAARPDVRILALDRSPAAARLARANVDALGLGAGVHVAVGDCLTGVGAGRADAILSNPPYLPSTLLRILPPEVCEHEPRLALDGGPDGLAIVRRLVDQARRVLRPGGGLLLETAGHGQVGDVAALFRASGFERVAVRPDLVGVDRFVAGRAGEPG
jgi:release factor glutamine methyltransferase